MKNTSTFLRDAVILFCLSMLVTAVVSQDKSQAGVSTDAPLANSIISGQLSDLNGNITDARIILQSFQDEKCAKLFSSKKYSEENGRKLQACSRELPPITPDKEGRYQFTNVPAGWYVLLVLWNMNQKPHATVAMFQKGEFIINYSEDKDASGKYDAMAQGQPFYFSGTERLVKDFDYRKGKISKMVKQ
ncbi:MAG TPA: hypothetical protein VF553_01800 [Pyrinomonadaceae bacterium]|jgi:hypothetical protein